MPNLPTYQTSHTDLPLTNISIAYSNTEYIAELIFPGVPVVQKSGKYYVYNKGDWFRREAAARAPGTRAARVAGFTVSTSPYNCIEIALAGAVTDEDIANADNPLRPYEDTTNLVTGNVLLQQEKDVANIAFGNSIWSSSATPSTLWGNDTSDPLGDVEQAACAIKLSIARGTLFGTLGYEVWSKLKNHPDIVDRIKYAAGPGNPAIVSLQAFAALCELQAIYTGLALENSSAMGQADSIAPVWGKHFLVYFKPPSPALKTPSAGYVLKYMNREVSRFREEQERQDLIEVRASYDVVQTALDAGYLLKSVVS